ncbi:MAG: DNA/RNA non-specific endonuclease [Colwellia sp.]|uniref:DNA/RNA non-specific endonuclease n=1 Tax=Colwellia sp. TaxID=56799 RepID=UPI001D8A7716|nr:DNA/RNA non-specific endonuclease [Colwellia sp.]NQY48935.1 DNA/RNA non-specific endonuclease [Colwellia sp.]NQZ24726.1 DNA/RNA non-specific endonuclease [Colwellia sp.]
MRILTLFFLIPTLYITNAQALVEQQYTHYKLWVDCKERASIAFYYVASEDKGNKTKYNSFYDDPSLPQSCQQLSREAYSHYNDFESKYHRAQLAAANHFDFDKAALKEANFMANVLPQTLQLNRGAWKRTEELVECYRDSFDVVNYGGVIWGTDSRNDLFVNSHGIRTPDYFWRVLVGEYKSQKYFSAWIVPNANDARASKLQHYAVGIEQLIARVEYEEIKSLLNSLEVKFGKKFKYNKGCKAYVS